MLTSSSSSLLLLLLILSYNILIVLSSKNKEKIDPNDNKGNTPFFLQDPRDSTCLGPNGFTVCDERALWILTRRPGKKTYSLVSFLQPNEKGMCLEHKKGLLGIGGDNVGMGLCSKDGSMKWDFDFVDKTYVKLSTKGQCLVRGKKTYKNSISLQNCKKGGLQLVYHPTAVHEAGFFFKSADGQCFDGQKFRSCEGNGANRLLWGVGVKYIWGKANRYFYNFAYDDRNSCIVASGSKVTKGKCTDGGALKWGLYDGKLSTENGKKCLARLSDDTAAMAKCSEASEFISMDLPLIYTKEQLAELLKNPENLTPEEQQYLANMIKQQNLARGI